MGIIMAEIKNAFPTVCFDRCSEYELDRITEIIKKDFSVLGVDSDFVKGKKIAIKPNLVSAKNPDSAATTHPVFVEAVYNVLREIGADSIILAESPGGPYSKPALSHIYKVTGMASVSEKTGLELNLDTDFRKYDFIEGKKLKSFDIISPIAECDVIINICKLKTHSLTGLSCSLKNLFGVIPGVIKFEMHAAYSKLEDFSRMLVDLNLSLAKDKKIISICDGIVSMEGNGPTNGTSVKTGVIFASDCTAALDIAAEKFIGSEGETLYLDYAAEELGIDRQLPDGVLSDNDKAELKRPDSKSWAILSNLSTFMGGRLARFVEPKPKVNNNRCIGCGKCVGYCPQKTISLKKKGNRKVARINKADCIRCYCCQELCPEGAVDTVKNPIVKLIH